MDSLYFKSVPGLAGCLYGPLAPPTGSVGVLQVQCFGAGTSQEQNAYELATLQPMLELVQQPLEANWFAAVPRRWQHLDALTAITLGVWGWKWRSCCIFLAVMIMRAWMPCPNMALTRTQVRGGVSCYSTVCTLSLSSA